VDREPDLLLPRVVHGEPCCERRRARETPNRLLLRDDRHHVSGTTRSDSEVPLSRPFPEESGGRGTRLRGRLTPPCAGEGFSPISARNGRTRSSAFPRRFAGMTAGIVRAASTSTRVRAL